MRSASTAEKPAEMKSQSLQSFTKPLQSISDRFAGQNAAKASSTPVAIAHNNDA
jgi:hypothetical protein